jgi:hypothetical protein
MIIELVNPTVRRMAELQESMEEVFRHDTIHQKRLDAMEFNWSTFQSKITLIDEVFKVSQDLKSNNQIFESEVNQKIQGISGNVQKAIHKVDDMNLKIINMDENFRTARTEISEYANTVNYTKSAIIEEQNNLARMVERQVAEMKKNWMITSDRLDKAEHAVLAFTDKALPKMLADVEKNFRMIREIRKEFKENTEKKVDLVEFAKLKKTSQGDVDKLKDTIKELDEKRRSIEEYIQTFLPIERWNAISEAICKLSPKHLKAFIEHDELKMEELISNSQTPYGNIETLTNQAKESYNQHISRREIMKIEIEKAELEKLSSLNRARNGSSNRKITYDSSSELRRHHKRRGHRAHPHEVQVSEVFPKAPSSPTLSEKPEVDPSDLIREVEEKSGDITKVEENLDVKNEVKPEETQEIPEKIENFDDEVVEDLQEKELKLSDSNKKNSLDRLSQDLDSAFRPNVEFIENLEVNRFEGNSFFKYNPRSESDESRELPLGSAGFFHEYPKVDLSGIEADIQLLKTQQDDFQQRLDDFSSSFEESKSKINSTYSRLENFISQVSSQQSNFEAGLHTNLDLMQEEIKQIIMRNKQEKVDLIRQIALYHSEFKSSSSCFERLESLVNGLNETVVSFAEVLKIVHLLTSQEEEDRQSLQLLGYSESKSQKPYISLKSDCMSCSGQNPTILTAFKMACLNYAPSGIKYKHRTYSRKQLITVLGSLVNNSFNPPRPARYASEMGSYQSIPSLAEEPAVPARRINNRSQFIELPSLNASKLFSENETPFSSTRDIRKLN